MRFRFITTIFIVALFLRLPAQDKFFKVGEGEALPEKEFANFKKLQAWATGSSFGGGHAGMFTIAGKKVYYSNRCFTSGRATSEVIFYIQKIDGRIGKFLALPTALREHKVKQHGDKIVVTTYDEPSKSWLEVMSISSAMFTATPFESEQDIAGESATAE